MMTPKTALVFPGQGSQSVGMMQSLYVDFAVVRNSYAEASEVLGWDLWNLTSQGPEDQLNQTENTQPAMLVAGVATYRALQVAWQTAGLPTDALTPAFFAGHSLGEYSALVASGQLDFAQAVRLSATRAQAMQSAVAVGLGAMAAILGLDHGTIESVCAEVSQANPINGANQQVWLANDNAVGQVVIAGHRQAVEIACAQLKQAGAKRALLLPVSVPSHCPLMQPAAEIMQNVFADIVWQSARAPVIHNCDLLAHDLAADKVLALVKQLTQPVRWVETIQYFAAQGVSHVIELGPGKVLAGLNKRIDNTLSAQAIHDNSSLMSFIENYQTHHHPSV